MKKKNLLLTFLIAVTFLLGGGVMGQTTIELGTDSYDASYIPTSCSSKYGIYEQIYTADEITGATGYANGQITKIYFYSKAAVNRKIDIYIKHTTKTEFSVNEWIPSLETDLKFSSGEGTVSFIKNEWTEIELTTPFEYDGASNIMIIVDDNSNTTSSSVKFSSYSASYASAYITASSDLNPCDNFASTYRFSYKNHIKLTFESITYPKPRNLNADALTMTSTTATLNWAAPTATAGNTLSGYQYQYKAAGSTWSSTATTTINSCTINNLTAVTNYIFVVRAVYTDANSVNHYSDWAQTTFKTINGVPTQTWSFDASTNMPEGWTITASYSGYPKIYNSSSNSHSSSNSLQFYNIKDYEIIVLMPAIDESLNGKTLSFYAKNDNSTGTYSILIGYYNANNEFVSPTGYSKTITNNAYSDDPKVGYYEYDITGWPNDIRQVAIKGKHDASNYRSIYIDDVKIERTNACTPVSSPTVGTLTYNSAQLSWTAGDETSWKLQYKDEDDNDWTTIGVTSNPYTLIGLTESTTYIWKVAAWCDTSDDDNISTYVFGEDFSTPVQFPMPTSLAANNISTNSANITWTAGNTETAWQLYYSPYDYANPGSASPGDLINVSTTPAYTMTGLTGSTTYYVYVRANYGEDHYSSWTDAMSFRTTVLLPYSYDFTDESEMNSWTMYNCHPTQTGRTGSESNYYFHILYSGTYNPQYLITPLFQNNSRYLLVRFEYKKQYGGDTGPYPLLNVGYSLSDKEIGSFTWPSSATVEVNSDSYQSFEYIFQVEGIKYIAIKYDKNATYSNTDIDNISFTPIDKVYTGGSEEWNYLADWTPAGLPESTDDMYVNDAITIPSNCRALANSITLGPNGSLTIEDGGQLICNNAVAATVKKNISSWGSKSVGGWNFIASPISTNIAPSTVENMTEGAYDLYRFREGILLGWENYKSHTDGFTIDNGRGYLYANAAGKELSFAGTITPSSPDVNVDLSYTNDADQKYVGWNLVGNPFTADAYINRSYYRMVEQDGHVVIDPETSSSGAISPCEGVMVRATNTGQSVTFTTTAPAQSNQDNGNLQMVLAQNVATRGEGTAQTLDKAIVSFNEGSQLGKFYFGTQDANLYIPQNNEEYAIVSSSAQGEMPINFKAHRDGQYTITVNPQEVEMGYLHLVDNIAGTDIDLLATPSYTFNAKADDYESRFRLVFSANMVNADLNDDFAFFSNGQLVIANEGEAVLQVIDVTGRVVATESVNGTCSKAVNVKAGVYVLRLINGTNVKTQKIIVK